MGKPAAHLVPHSILVTRQIPVANVPTLAKTVSSTTHRAHHVYRARQLPISILEIRSAMLSAPQALSLSKPLKLVRSVR